MINIKHIAKPAIANTIDPDENYFKNNFCIYYRSTTIDIDIYLNYNTWKTLLFANVLDKPNKINPARRLYMYDRLSCFSTRTVTS